MGLRTITGIGGKLTPQQRNEVASLYMAGASLKSLSKKFGVLAKNIRGLVIARGLPIRPYVCQPARRRKFPKSPIPVHEKWATKQVELAKRRGDLVPPTTCSACEKPCKPHGHHDDYNFPLAVRWLCPTCHNDWHSLNIPIPSSK